MGNQKAISKRATRQMVGKQHKSKPFRTRVDDSRIEWVWENDMMVPKRVRKG